MSIRTENNSKPQASPVDYENFELGSFTQNVVTLESIVGRMENELSSEDPNADRVNIFQSEVQSLLGELHTQQARAIQLRGAQDENVQRLQRLVSVRIGAVLRKAEDFVRVAQSRLATLEAQRAALDSGNLSREHIVFLSHTTEPELLEVRELADKYLAVTDEQRTADDGVASLDTETSKQPSSDSSFQLAEAAKHLNELITAHPHIKDEAIPILKQLVDLAMRSIMERATSGSPPPGGPVDTSYEGADDGEMEARVTKIEADLAAIKTDVAVIKANGATKSDVADTKAAISDAKTSIILWVAGVVFLAQVLPAVLKLLPQ